MSTETVPAGTRFDGALGAWILSRYDDVLAALREPRLAAPGERGGSDANRVVRAAAASGFSSARLAAFRNQVATHAQQLATALPAGNAVDLVGSFARPLSLELAIAATGAPRTEAPELAELAHAVFEAAASVTDARARPPGGTAASQLARRLGNGARTLDVQSFVALSQTLPHFLAAAWLALFADPAATLLLRATPESMGGAVDELLRHAGPSRAVFRVARTAVRIGGARIAEGDAVILMLAAANHDPARFPEPERLDFRRDVRHVAFGGGAHSCVGARLIRQTVAHATEALLRTTRNVELRAPVKWIDGFAIRAPIALDAVLTHQ